MYRALLVSLKKDILGHLLSPAHLIIWRKDSSKIAGHRGGELVGYGSVGLRLVSKQLGHGGAHGRRQYGGRWQNWAKRRRALA